jgi:peptidylprolyl isomerase domain and WD repeat-containing protein 1
MQFGTKAAHSSYTRRYLGSRVSASNLIWDQLLDFKTCFAVVNIVSNRVVRLLGKDEAVRFLNLSLYQGSPAKKTITTMVRLISF